MGLGETGESTVDVIARAHPNAVANLKKRKEKKPARAPVKSLDWIKTKKEKHRRLGKEVKNDSKYTGRKRSAGF